MNSNVDLSYLVSELSSLFRMRFANYHKTFYQMRLETNRICLFNSRKNFELQKFEVQNSLNFKSKIEFQTKQRGN